jgi:hypothetical protein
MPSWELPALANLSSVLIFREREMSGAPASEPLPMVRVAVEAHPAAENVQPQLDKRRGGRDDERLRRSAESAWLTGNEFPQGLCERP